MFPFLGEVDRCDETVLTEVVQLAEGTRIEQREIPQTRVIPTAITNPLCWQRALKGANSAKHLCISAKGLVSSSGQPVRSLRAASEAIKLNGPGKGHAI
jgi:hypothetical protein